MAEIGVGLVGYKFMGRAHSNGYRQVAHFFDVDPAPKMVAICGRDRAAVSEAAKQLGWEGYETDYHKLIARNDIGLIDVSTPGDSHRDVVLAALAAGSARNAHGREQRGRDQHDQLQLPAGARNPIRKNADRGRQDRRHSPLP